MSITTTFLTPALHEYIIKISLREHPILAALRTETMSLQGKEMLLSPEQGQCIALLLKLMGAKNILDIGTFTGYSALNAALAISENGSPDGHVITCDIDEKATEIAKNYFKKANMENNIELRLGPALDTLNNLLNTHQAGLFDFVFIDADKQNYINYYEKALQLLRTGGLIAIDNVLWDGQVIDSADHSPSTEGIRLLNQHISQDRRIDLSIIAIGDGMALARKL